MEIKMPQLGESVTEGTIARWLVKPGDRVSKYQPIAEVITDKVNAEIPAPIDGVITSLEIATDLTVKVGTLIARMAADGEAPAASSAANQGASAPAPAAVAPTPTAEGGGRYSPAVMRLAQEHGLDLTRIKGTGLGGRITRKDVETAIAAGGTAAMTAPPPAAPAPVSAAPSAPAPDPSCMGSMVAAQALTTSPSPALAPAPSPAVAPAPAPMTEDQVIPVDAVRRRIAEKMVQSRHEAPHAWTMVQVDVTGLVKLREAMSAEFQRREGITLSYMPFFIKAVVEALREYPIINSQWAGDKIILKRDINISIAVATETALAVPVIKHADRLSITGLNHAVSDLAQRARTNRLTMDDITGGTFTVNNTGYFGSFMSAPIINHPQAAIVNFEVITKTPVVLENDAIAIRSMMNLCMSLDHRILDGLVCGRFLQAIKKRLESYAPGTVALF